MRSFPDSRSLRGAALGGVACAILALVGCRDEHRTTTQPRSIGGGPPADRPEPMTLDRYAASSALDVLVSAECHRARVCSFDVTPQECVQSSLAAHGDLDLGHCPRGVDATALSSCARVLREAPCDVEPAQPDSCRVAVLCPAPKPP